MLKVFIPGASRWDEYKEEFINTEPITIEIEHSLVSMSEWEAKYKKPFMDNKEPKTPEEMFDYIHMMCLDKTVKKEDLLNLTPENVKEIQAYIDEKRSATTFSKDQTGKPLRETITSELIYAWLVLQNIPFEVETWHVSRILTLINVVAIKNQPPKKESPADAINRARAWKKAKAGNVPKPHIPKH
jgi:hypothetical protein